MTPVVHVRDVLDRLKAGDPEVVYIGRQNRAYSLKGSPLGNPHRITKACPREDAVELFRWTMKCRLESPSAILWQERLRDIRGKTLACWCKGTQGPDVDVPCHGDVLAELADAL